jgi:hypothetical protein
MQTATVTDAGIAAIIGHLGEHGVTVDPPETDLHYLRSLHVRATNERDSDGKPTGLLPSCWEVQHRLSAPVYTTDAERRGFARAEKLAADGYNVTVTINDNEPLRYEDGGQMTSGFRAVHVWSHGEWYETTLGGHWVTVTQPSEGSRRTTRYGGGEWHRSSAKAWPKLPTEKALDLRISCETGYSTKPVSRITIERGES